MTPNYKRYFLRLSYNGTAYSGWQFQKNVPTIQGELEKTLSAILKDKITCIGCGRTDAGVHASKYYAHIDTMTEGLENDQQFLFRLNKSLPSGIAVQKLYRMPENAHARFSASGRSYEYHVSKEKNALSSDLVWHVGVDLNTEAMNDAAKVLIGQYDFLAFSKSGNTTSTTLCTVTRADWQEYDDKLIFHISSNRFLRNMVRMLVGTLVEIGRGNVRPELLRELLVSRQQPSVLHIAPANGLFLSDVVYPERFQLD